MSMNQKAGNIRVARLQRAKCQFQSLQETCMHFFPLIAACMAFPGLTTLFSPDGRALFECVRMGHNVLACRRPAQGEDGDHSFAGFAPIIKGSPEQ